MNTKICKQCGELKPIEQYRKYYGGRKGHYNTCKLCEKINARAKYLKSKGDEISKLEEIELNKIYKLYEVQRQAGLQPPNQAMRVKPISESIDDMLTKYDKNNDGSIIAVPVGVTVVPERFIPADLQIWLKCELTEEPDYYLDEVYEELKAKYRPQLRIDQVTLQPVYDDTYKDVLEQILGRFNAYEDEYWNK